MKSRKDTPRIPGGRVILITGHCISHSSICIDMIFFATPLARGQSTSRLFENYGAMSMGPGPVSAARVYAPPNSNDLRMVQRYNSAAIPMIIGSSMKSTVTSNHLGCFYGVHSIHFEESNFLFNIPNVVVSLSDPSETKVAKLESLSFRKKSAGRYQFFQGPSSQEIIPQLAQLGCDLAAYAPQETVNIHGYLTALAMRRILYHLFSNNFQLSRYKLGDQSIAPSRVGIASTSIESIAAVKTGHFFPYFDGLVLPERAATIASFIARFSRCLGNDDESVSRTVATLASGWNSLYNTHSGKVISHLMACVDLAWNGGHQIRPIYYKGEYLGTILVGHGSIFTGGKINKPVTGQDLATEVSRMLSHDSAIIKIAAVLSTMPKHLDKAIEAIEPKEITTPRVLHYMCRDRVCTPDATTQVNEVLPQLRFQETLWKATDEGYLAMAVTALTNKEFLSDTAPFDIKSGALFTKDSTLSTLSAFGTSAPSLMGHVPYNVTLNIKEGFLRGTKQGSLQGLPIFVKPLQTAVEDWDQVIQGGVIAFKTKGKDNFGQMRVADCRHFVKTSTQDGSHIINRLVSRAGKKRGREVEEGDEDRPRASAAKKAKTMDLSLADFGFTGAEEPQVDTPVEEWGGFGDDMEADDE